MNITEEQDWYEYYASLSENDKQDIVNRASKRIEQSMPENRLNLHGSQEHCPSHSRFSDELEDDENV